MEKPIQFHCRNKKLYGILHQAATHNEIRQIILMIVGGPQTRIGSHRLHVQLARALQNLGFTIFRFDYEGLGDSEGDFVGFEYAGPSIQAAIDYLFAEYTELEHIIIWSLCDGATASCVYAQHDQHRVKGMVLCNPFVETDAGKARTIIRYYYVKRLFEKEFWRKVFSFKFDVVEFIRSFLQLALRAWRSDDSDGFNGQSSAIGVIDPNTSLPQQMINGLDNFQHKVRFLLSTDDLTALNFRDVILSHPTLKEAIDVGRIKIRYIQDADHTFSSQKYKNMLVDETVSAIEDLNSNCISQTTQSADVLEDLLI